MKHLTFKFLSLIGILLFFVGGIFYFKFFKKSPTLEEKFIQEPIFPSPTVTLKKETPKVALTQPSDKTLLQPTKIAFQTFNNCGPATLSMILSFYDIYKSQQELGKLMRPYQNPKGDNDDKTIFPQEFVSWVKKHGLEARFQVGGTIDLLKLFLANDIPVVTKTWLKPNEDIGHFRIVRGFDENKKVLISDDSYFGSNRKISYFQFLEMWQPFNYGYVVVYKKEEERIVEAILGEEVSLQIVYQKALKRAEKESELVPDNIYPIFNMVTSYYHLGEYEKSIETFEKVETRLPRRMLWYQIESILAYQKAKRYEKALVIIEKILTGGNRAFSELYQIRGEIYLERRDKEAAKREFELALKYNENFELAKEVLSKL